MKISSPVTILTPLVTVDMYKQIVGQAAYQVLIILVFHFFGSRIFNIRPEINPDRQPHHNEVVQTVVFNIFVFTQIFNSINSHRVDSKLNVLGDFTRNRYLMGTTLLGMS